MAYFSNGTEGDYYEEKYCQRCIHYDFDDNKMCPILELHFRWNYDACNGNKPDATPEVKAKYKALNTLWPQDGVHNGECAMFHEIGNES